MPPLLGDRIDERDIELDEIRRRMGAELGAGDQRLIKLRRVTWGSLLNLALLSIAAFALIGMLGGLDLDAFVDALADANWWWLAFALVLAQLPRIPSAVSTMGSIRQPIPLGPLTTLQFAICYVNLAIPSTAARVAINIRFFQRIGVTPTAAVSAGVIDSVSGFVVQIALFLALFFASDLDLGLSGDTDELDGLLTIALIALIVIVAIVLVVLFVPAVRTRALRALRQVRAAVGVLRSPTKLLQLFGGNLLSQVGFAIALGACVKAFGAEVPLSSLVLINTVVTLFAGLLPVPGGIGVSEAGLTLGLTRAGLPDEIAFATALAYRFASFYLPPIWGYFCYRWLVRRRYL
jgi:glycosyltransferase 2 family protein